MADIVSAKTLVFCDLSRGYFVRGRYDKNPTQTPFEQFFSKNALNLEIYPLVINPTSVPAQDPFNIVDVSGLSLDASIYDSTGATLLATQATFTPNSSTGTLTGSLDCNTGPMASAVTSDPTQILIEFRFTGSFGSRNVRAAGASTVIRKQFNSSGTPAPVAGDVYLTEKQIRAMFIPREGSPGDSWTAYSPDGTRKFLVYFDNDGVLRTDPIS